MKTNKTAVLEVKVTSLQYNQPFKPHSSYIIYLSLAKRSTQIQKQFQSIDHNKMVINQTLRMDCGELDMTKHKYCLLFIYEIMEHGRKNVIGNVPINLRQNIGKGVKSYRLMECKDPQATLEAEIELVEQHQNGKQIFELQQPKNRKKRQLAVNMSSTLSLSSSNAEIQIGNNHILKAEDENKNINKQFSSPTISSFLKFNLHSNASNFGREQAELHSQSYSFKKRQKPAPIRSQQKVCEGKKNVQEYQQLNSPVKIYMPRQSPEKQSHFKLISTQSQREKHQIIEIIDVNNEYQISPSFPELKQLNPFSEEVLSQQMADFIGLAQDKKLNQLDRKLQQNSITQKFNSRQTFGVQQGSNQEYIYVQPKKYSQKYKISQELIYSYQPKTNPHNFKINKVISLAFVNAPTDPFNQKGSYSKFSKIQVFKQRQKRQNKFSLEQNCEVHIGKVYTKLTEIAFLQQRLLTIQSRCNLLVKANQKLTLDHQIGKLELQKQINKCNTSEEVYKGTIKQLNDQITKMIQLNNENAKLRERQKKQFAQVMKLNELYTRENNDMKKKIIQYYETTKWMKRQLNDKKNNQERLGQSQVVKSSEREKHNDSNMTHHNLTSNKNNLTQRPPLPYQKQKIIGVISDRKADFKFNEHASFNKRAPTEYDVVVNNSKQGEKGSVCSHKSYKSSLSSQKSSTILKAIGHIHKDVQKCGSVASNSSIKGLLVDLLQQQSKIKSNVNTQELQTIKRQSQGQIKKVYFMDKLFLSKGNSVKNNIL